MYSLLKINVYLSEQYINLTLIFMLLYFSHERNTEIFFIQWAEGS